ncbi:hypothetical protein AVEN_129193-1 [Araneus ventricosus]|uniref:Uncharacterized protein n=1 Tax=Araneus ventricosus TaxID=182803 RepID=A0A4Y2H8N9_ARAVE|nr:hypothetical protein AVEN_129193-1 [Araneus ventricosus]
MMIGSSVDYVRSGGMRNVPITKAVEHLYATTAKFSGNLRLTSCLFLPATSVELTWKISMQDCDKTSNSSEPGIETAFIETKGSFSNH